MVERETLRECHRERKRETEYEDERGSKIGIEFKRERES